MTESKLIDSSVWIDYLVNGNHKEIIELEEIFLLSSISLFEIKKKLLRLNYKKEDISISLSSIKEKSNILQVTKEIAETAAEISFEKNMGAVDSIIYETALKNNAKLISLDNDFRGLKNTQILE
ncbi:MAG: PIN domain-containing protein [Nanoarchaeota archaeon]